MVIYNHLFKTLDFKEVMQGPFEIDGCDKESRGAIFYLFYFIYLDIVVIHRRFYVCAFAHVIHPILKDSKMLTCVLVTTESDYTPSN
jgi:hypothetical protein